MIPSNDTIVNLWRRVGPKFLPFADGASETLPLGRLIRLSLFQVSIGLALVLLNGTLNRIMIIELGVASSIVAAMISLPILLAPLRLLLGYKSDNHRSFLGWRRVPYIWGGTLLQFGGLAIMPFALIVLSGDTNGPAFVGPLSAALSFLLVGAGIHTTQTAGLALANDLAEPSKRHRVVALLYVMLLIGSFIASLAFAWVLSSFSQVRLIQVIQGAALLTMVLNMVALWKQEPRRPTETRHDLPRPPISETWRRLKSEANCLRMLVAVALGTAAFSMQDILLEPYGGEILGLSVAGTTALTALVAAGTLAGYGIAARHLDHNGDALRLAAIGLLVGIVAFSAIIFASPLANAWLFRAGAALIGVGTGLFAAGTMTAAMQLVRDGLSGQVLGAWGTVSSTAAGLAIAASGFIKDAVGHAATAGSLGPALHTPASGYIVVYHIEIGLLFAGLVAIGPLIKHRVSTPSPSEKTFGLAEFPG
ncbi:MAG: BCD family MFS transporter [Proteobacteria bacterium]|nr:BCD family MFS transporter [Pseudomonadota bacterium]